MVVATKTIPTNNDYVFKRFIVLDSVSDDLKSYEIFLSQRVEKGKNIQKPVIFKHYRSN